MPAYDYTCTNCSAHDVRIAGIDDHTSICGECGQVMVRDQDIDSLLQSYQTNAPAAKTKIV